MAVWASIQGLSCRECNEQIASIRGCKEDIKEILIEGIEVKRCPLKLITGQSKAYMEIYNWHKQGYFTRDILSQPTKMVEAIQHIDKEFIRLSKTKE